MKNILSLALLTLTLNAHGAAANADIMRAMSQIDASVGAGVLVSDGNFYQSKTISGDATLAKTGALSIPLASADGAQVAKVAKATYDFSVQGGTVGAHSLNVNLPAKAIITNSLLEVVTPIVSTSNDGTLALSCEDANNIFTATDIDSSSAGDVLAGTAAPTAPVGHIGAACAITATIAVHPFTAGKVIVWVYYVQGL